MKKRKITALLMSVILMLTYSAVFVPPAVASTASIATYDSITGEAKGDFSPEETVLIAGPGFPATTNIDVKVTRPDGTMVKGDAVTPGYDTVTTDSVGNLSYNYTLNGIEGLYAVDAVESATGSVLATTTFTDSKFYLRGFDNVDLKWTGGNLKGWNELDWVPYRLKIAIVSRDLDSGTGVFTKTFAIQHDNQWTGSGGPDPGVDEVNYFYIGDEAGNPIPGATWVLNPPTPTYPTEPNTTVIQYDGTFTAPAGTYYLYWKAHIALGASGWSGSSLHAHTTASGSQDVPISVPGAAPTPDTQAPTGTVTINSGATYTNSTSVTLTLSATDNVGVTEMMISNDPTFTGAVWEPYATTKAWTLTSGADGTRTVYVLFKDNAGNISDADVVTPGNQPYTDTIILDTTSPTIDSCTGSGTGPGNPLTVTTHVTDIYEVATVKLHYLSSSYLEKTLTMTRVSGTAQDGIYQATIPGPDVTTDLEYYISAVDGATNPKTCGFFSIPNITSISPPSGPVGTSVTITGTDFGATQGTSTMTFNGVDAGTATSWSDIQIVINVPIGATDGPVVVTTSYGSSNGVPFDVTPGDNPPTVMITAPPSGTVSGTVNVTANATDDNDITKVEWYVDDALQYTENFPGSADTNVNSTYAWNTTGWGDGAHSVKAISYDNASPTSQASSPDSRSYTVNNPPSAPSGLNAAPGDTVVNLTWNANTESDIGGYKVYYGTSPGIYTTTLDVGIVTSYTVTGLTNGTTYYFVVTAYDTAANESGPSVEKPAKPEPGPIEAYDAGRYEEQTGAISYTGTEWGVWTNPNLSGASEKYSPVAGDKATLTFTGTSVSYVVGKFWNRGIAKIYIDGVLQGSVDLYAPSPGQFKQVVYTKNGLSLGTHTITIENSGTKNAFSNGYHLGLDAFDVFDGTKTVRYEQQSGQIVYVGTWEDWSDGRASGAAEAYSKTAGNSFTFSFKGKSASWYTARAWNRGIAKVYVDGVFVQNVDLYSSTIQYQQPVYTWSGLWGSHTIKVEITGTKNPSATDSYIGLDYFELPRTYLDNTSAGVTYVQPANWLTWNHPNVYGGSEHYTNVTGAYFQISWEGTAVIWQAAKAPNRGRARVYVDGVDKGLVDLYDPNTQTSIEPYKLSGLTYGTHTLKVEATGTKNAASTGTYIALDVVKTW